MRCPNRRHQVLALLGIAFVLAATALPTPVQSADQRSVLINDVPHVRQKPDFCGEACVASWLQKLGSAADQDAVFDRSGLDPTLARGCYTAELASAIRHLGFAPGPVWHRIDVANQKVELNDLWQTMIDDLRRGTPSIVCMRTSEGPEATEHFRLILGYDAKQDEVIYHEPAHDLGAYHHMPLTKFLSLWPLKYKAKEWTVIRFALASEQTPRVAASKSPTNADYAQHIMRLKARLPHKNFTIVLQRPFVVIGDEAPHVVRGRSEKTVKWATDRLKSAYFRSDPDRVLDVWLFKDKQSYEANTMRLFRDKPTTPYGYYSPSENALVMNIATGGGTLVHEIVHPFMEANFPDCPAWFNEGLGSLYEQSSSRDGQIVGLTNWRLAGLQRAIADDDVPSFATLCATSSHQFYQQDPGTNYSQARYLCYYLQEQGLLHKYYHQFVANQKTDPTGYQTLQKILDSPDMTEFQEKWQAYV
ncbi:MAG: hypothetical protein HKN47_11325, partial [Pirellulaceae bacterium]|nr:hypothetical protein [Pirellulaceae bacterium]